MTFDQDHVRMFHRTLICITAHALSYSVVNDLAKAMKALDGNVRMFHKKSNMRFVICPFGMTYHGFVLFHMRE